MFNASWQLVRHLICQVEWNSVSAPGYLRVGVALGRGAGQFHLPKEKVTNLTCPKEIVAIVTKVTIGKSDNRKK